MRFAIERLTAGNRSVALTHAVIGLTLLFSLLSGCGDNGPELAPVRGRVTLDGRPVPEAIVTFQPEEGMKSPSTGHTNNDGQYELGYKRGVMGGMVGSNLVRIRSITPGPKAVPARYAKSFDLRREVKLGENTIDFELTTVEKK